MILVKNIRDPGRTCSPSEDAALRTVLSVLSSEEMAMHLPQPSGIGRRPTNVSADSMLVIPDLKPEDLFPIRRYNVYTPPPKGYFYETKETSNSNNSGCSGVKNRIKPNKYGKSEYREVFPDPPTLHNFNLQATSNVFPNAVPFGGRPICKSYGFKLPDGN